jgi:hypothetical protein
MQPTRLLVVRAHILEFVVSSVFMGVGTVLWWSMNGPNFGTNLLAGSAFLVAGIMVLLWALKSILKYKHR